jgi:hypothetical protein
VNKTQINPICITALIPGIRPDGSYLQSGKAENSARYVLDDIAQSLAVAAAVGANSVSHERLFTPEDFAVFIQAANQQPMTLVTIPAYQLEDRGTDEISGMQPYIFSAVALSIGKEAEQLGMTYPGLPTKATVHVAPMNTAHQLGYGNPELAAAA